MANPITFLFGYATLTAPLSSAADILNAAREHGIVYRNQKSDGENISLECSLSAARRMRKACASRGIPLLSDSERGAPHLLKKYRKRYGIFIGGILAVILIILSGTVVWDIRIDGKKRLSEEQVLSELEACGLHIGSRIRELNTDAIQTKMIILSDDVSWISINLIGTVAHVEIRESEPMPQKETLPAAANLIATDDGEIVGFEEVRGDIAVKIGDFVRKGELLVSGIRESKTQGFIYSVARGRVFAKITTEYGVNIPLKYEKKKYEDAVYKEKYIIFFNKEIKIYSNNRKNTTSCDIIDTVEYANVFSMGKLPFGIRTVKHLPYSTEVAERSAEEAVELAFSALRMREEELMISDVISKQFSGSLTDGVYRLRCTAVSVKNIAKQQEVEIVT